MFLDSVPVSRASPADVAVVLVMAAKEALQTDRDYSE
jgi:hypothetical protein